jgi:hypothetical protein
VPSSALDVFFGGRARAHRLFRAVERAAGPVELRVGKSQVAFVRGRAFAWAWCPDRWLRGELAPLVLSIALPRRDRSPRWKEVVRPGARPKSAWMHHLELRSAGEVDAFVRERLREAAEAALSRPRAAPSA